MSESLNRGLEWALDHLHAARRCAFPESDNDIELQHAILSVEDARERLQALGVADKPPRTTW